jgi:hypothetical protein
MSLNLELINQSINQSIKKYKNQQIKKYENSQLNGIGRFIV